MKKSKYISRSIEPIMISAVKQFPALVLSGSRQTGKSTLLKKLFGKTHRYISFDDPIQREQAISDPRLFLDSIGERVIIDEIQYVPQLMSYIKIKIDSDRHLNGRYLFTGSQQFNLIRNLGDSLAGRVVLFNLFPFDLKEKDKVPSLKTKAKSCLDNFVAACLKGSYPEVLTKQKVDINQWYGSYLQTYLERDIRFVYDIGSLRDFQRFIQLLAGRTAQILNLSTLSNELDVAVTTVKRWISILEASQIIYLLSPYYRNFGKRFTKSPKVYFYDVGLVCYLTGIRNKSHLVQGPMSGACFENFCVQETLKMYAHKGLRPKLYYYRSHNSLEIDLIIEGQGMKLFPVEFKMSKTPNSAMAGGIERYRKIYPKLPVKEGKVVNLREEQIALTKTVSSCSYLGYLNWLERLI